MIAVTQVVDSANVGVKGLSDTKREIEKGLIVFLGVSKTDTENDVDKLANKLIKLRVFPDGKEKMNLDIQSIHGEILLIPQFTLLGSLKGNNRPDFSKAAEKDKATALYEFFTDKLIKTGLSVKTGYFGEHMILKSNLNGPVTIILESDKI
jgi:D-tyrosyl-tRNA(Tyr) deacylase